MNKAKDLAQSQSKPFRKAAVPKPLRMTPAQQRRRFIEAARESGASEDEAEFDKALGAIVKPKAEPAS